MSLIISCHQSWYAWINAWGCTSKSHSSKYKSLKHVIWRTEYCPYQTHSHDTPWVKYVSHPLSTLISLVCSTTLAKCTHVSDICWRLTQLCQRQLFKIPLVSCHITCCQHQQHQDKGHSKNIDSHTHTHTQRSCSAVHSAEGDGMVRRDNMIRDAGDDGCK